jgi:ATP-binding cassette subfamily F protein 3
MIIVRAHNIYKSFGSLDVLSGISFQIDERERIGLVGANGVGKTTVFRIITGELEPDQGEIFCSKGIRIGYLPQEITVESDTRTVMDEILSADRKLLNLKAQMDELSQLMSRAPGEALNRTLRQYGDLQEQYEYLGGYTYESRARAVLEGLGFGADDYRLLTSQLSGGQRSRLALARLLVVEPDLLLLDEPTNHLDIEAIEWLERMIADYPGSIITISHDRYLLDKTAKRILELEPGGIHEYPGNYSQYREARMAEITRMEKAYELQAKEIARQEEFIRRNIAGQKTKQAQSRRKMLGKIKRLERPHHQKTMLLHLSPQLRGGNCVLEATSLSKRYEDRTLFDDLNFILQRGDRVGIVGPNGTGKTTFLRIITGLESPTNGDVHIGKGIQVGYFDQHLAQLDPDNTIIEELWQIHPTLTMEAVRTFLGHFLFTGDSVFGRVGDLSGGEQSRLLLAQLMLAKVNFLILDEPTNHLDFMSRAVLEEALLAYEGTILTVSHDRYFLDKIAHRILYFGNDTTIREYPGNYTEFAERRAREALYDQEAVATSKREQKGPAPSPRRRTEIRTPEQIEGEIIQIEDRLGRIAQQMSHPGFYTDPDRVRTATQEYQNLSLKRDRLYAEWQELEG